LCIYTIKNDIGYGHIKSAGKHMPLNLFSLFKANHNELEQGPSNYGTRSHLIRPAKIFCQ